MDCEHPRRFHITAGCVACERDTLRSAICEALPYLTQFQAGDDAAGDAVARLRELAE